MSVKSYPFKLKTYSFWDDRPTLVDIKKWRVCLGNNNSCLKQVKGYAENRLCDRCKFKSKRAEARK